MSASSPAQPAKSFADRFSLAQSIITLALATCGTLLTAGMFQGGLSSRITSLEGATQRNEQNIERNRAEREQRLHEKLDVKVYDTDRQNLSQTLQRIETTVKQIRDDQVEELKERAKTRQRQ